MTFRVEGFLEDAERERIANIRHRHAQWFSIVEKLNRLAMMVLLRERPMVNEEVYIGTLYARAVSMFQGVVRLAERGMGAEARTLVRACAETAIALGCVRRDKGFFDRLDEDYDKHRLALANDLLRLVPEDDPNLSVEQRTELQQFVDGLSAQYSPAKSRPINWADAAVAAGLTDLYVIIYRTTSADGAHVSLKALERYLQVDGRNNIKGFRFSPEFEIADTLSAAIAALMHATEAKLSGAGDAEGERQWRELIHEWNDLVASDDAAQ
jgi:hypothetical protein